MTVAIKISKSERIAEIKNLILEKKNKIEELKRLADMNNAMQLGIKLVLNGTYGAFLNKHFVCFCNGVGSTITSHGRELTQTMNDKNEEYWYNDFHKDIETQKSLYTHAKVIDYIHENNLDIREIIKDDRNHDGLYTSEYDRIVAELNIDFDNLEMPDVKPLDDSFINWETREKVEDPTWSQIYEETGAAVRAEPVSIYADTDSVYADTVILTNKGRFTIENLYNKNIDRLAGYTVNGHESVLCDDNVLNYNDNGELYYGKVKRLIRHKVKKAKWKLKTKQGKEIIVTNDHSMIVFRDGKKLEVKPSEILKSDKILIVKER